ncbi:cytochrome b pre-mRNA-processing protein 3 [Rhizobiales bacterium GAS188]|nr:cytochrome b pre-mRNA-processing protein 3 [Rhizobiales bacterium GAS188]
MWPFVRRNRLAPVERLHDSIAALARDRDLFTKFGVADTFEGRFELLALHLALVLRRLADLPAPAADMAQDLTDLAFRRLDQGLREIGIGDMGVPKRMKGLAKHFYGRAAAYHAALASGDAGKLVEALRRNVFDGGAGDAEGLATRVAAVERRLSGLDLENLLTGLDLKNLLTPGLSGPEAGGTAAGGPR